MESRAHCYFIALVIGIIYLGLFVLSHLYLETTTWIPIIDMIYFIFNIAIIIVLIVKDALDELNIQHGSPPIGPQWFEHSTFILMVALQLVISIQYDTVDLISYVKVGLFFLAVLDFIWDLWQDHTNPKFQVLFSLWHS